MKVGGSKAKGNGFEWEIARTLSLWLTDGQDKTQLIRSVQSGGHIQLRNAAFNQVGDLAPNGPAGDVFRQHFGVECKNQATEPDWWNAITYKDWYPQVAWEKIREECKPLGLLPLLFWKMNRRPTVVFTEIDFCKLVIQPELIVGRLSAAVITMKTFLAYPPMVWFHAKSAYTGTDALLQSTLKHLGELRKDATG